MDANKKEEVLNGSRRRSVSFTTNHDVTSKTPTIVNSSSHHPEGLLDKYLSCRWVVTYMCTLVFVVVPMLQNCLSMVLVCMESNYKKSSIILKYNQSNTTNNITAPEEQSVWNIRLEGDIRSQILSAEFYALPFTPLIGGYLSGRFSAKMIIIVIVLLMAGSSSATPIALTVNPYIAIGLRCIVGLSFGGLQASITELLAKWAPLNERAQIVSTVVAGLFISFIVNYSASGFICTIPVHNGWPLIMYIFSASNLLMLIPWVILVYDSPYEHPRITPPEIEIIRHRRRDSTVAKMSHPPWIDILRSGPFWGIFFCQLGYGFISTTTGTFVPLYLNDVLKFDVTSNGLLSSLPFIARLLSCLGGGHVADLLIARGILSTTAVRKLFQTTGNILSVPFLIGLSYMDSSQATYAVLLLVIFWFIQALNTSSLKVNVIDIAPRFAGVLTGMSVTVLHVAAMLSPIVTFELTKNRTQEEWQVVFFICASLSVCSAMMFLVLGSGVEQSWAKDPTLEEEISVGDPAKQSSVSDLKYKNQNMINGHVTETHDNERSTSETGINTDLKMIHLNGKNMSKFSSQSVQVNKGFAGKDEIIEKQAFQASTHREVCPFGVMNNAFVGDDDDTVSPESEIHPSGIGTGSREMAGLENKFKTSHEITILRETEVTVL
ncbi:sialin-like [Saccostrea echinata]|uniref:sialin-like n=1 Tax=Saccostrea echinata TaxID=191078 RepID=UPI002A83AF83|nr:sialin-like [Saccostrea echinata]